MGDVINANFDSDGAPEMLRVLADQIERGISPPSYALIVDSGKSFDYVFNSGNNVHALSGMALRLANKILEQLDHD